MKKGLILSLAFVMTMSVGAFAANKNPKGTLTVSTISDWSTFNPVVSEDSSETDVENCIFDGLLRMDNQGDFSPDLATVVPTQANGGISADNKVFTFHLRKGVKWHDGKPFTAEDVKFTVDCILNPDVPVPSRSPWDQIKKFEVIDDYTIKMTMKKIQPDILIAFSGPSVIPAHYFKGMSGKELGEALGKGGKFSRNPIGTGPFKFDEWKSGSYASVVANEDYFGEGPYLNKIIFKVLPDTNTQIVQLKTGEVDMASMTGTYYDQVKDIKGLRVKDYPASSYGQMTVNTTHYALKEKAVRQALMYGLPRQQIIDSVLGGFGSVANGSVSPINWAYNKKVSDEYPFNPAKAESLLEKAGWKMGKDGIRYKNGKPLSFEISTNSGNKTREAIEQVAQQYWKKIGVDLKIRNYEWTTFIGPILENFKFDLALFAWISSPDPDQYSLYHSKQIPTDANGKEGQNYAQWVNKQADILTEGGLGTLDKAKRKAIYGKLQEIVIEELPMLFVYNSVTIDCTPPNLKNYKPAPYTNGRFWNVNEWSL